MLWLYFEFPRLQLETQYPEPQSGPVAVVDESHNTLVQANALALSSGIRLGMGLATAAALCQDIQLVPYNANLEVQRLQEVAQELYAISGEISLNEPSGIWLGATSMIKYHNGLNNYCENIKALLGQFQLSYRFGSGYSPLAAQLLARANQNQAEDDAAQLRTACGHCSLELTPLPKKLQEKLKRLGIQSLQALLAIPLKELAHRFDGELVQYIGRLSGQLKHPLKFYQPPENFYRYRELPHELNNTQHLAPWLEQLLQDLERFLQRRDRVVERLELHLHQREQPPLSLTIGSARRESRMELWHPLVALTLESQTLSAPVYALTLEANELLARTPGDQDLFEQGSRGQLNAPQLVARLQARLGKEAVRGLCVQDDFRPARASASCDPLSPKADQAPASSTGLRPSFLLPAPRPYSKPLELVSGPERIATGWWDGDAQMRDYYIARNSEGQWCWVFKEARQTVWFLQGFFS